MKINNIQVLRALAANSVIIFHLLANEKKYGNGSNIIPEHFHFLAGGVDLFFVISGFIMTTIISTDTAWKIFMVARIRRIYPPYWIYTTMMLIGALFMTSISRSDSPSTLLSYLLIPQNDFPILPVGWTLIHEMYFYVVMGAIIAFKVPMKAALLWWSAIILAASFMDKSDINPILGVVAHPLTLEFIMGAAVGLLAKKSKVYLPMTICMVGTASLLGSFAFMSSLPIIGDHAIPPDDFYRIAFIGLPSAMIVYGVVFLRQARGNLLVVIGDASYSIYLCHILIISALGKVFMSLGTHGYISEAVYIIAVIFSVNLCGLLSYRMLEVPITRYLNKI